VIGNIDGDYPLRNPIFLDRVSGFDWTVIPV